jgi:hypothetical protein
MLGFLDLLHPLRNAGDARRLPPAASGQAPGVTVGATPHCPGVAFRAGATGWQFLSPIMKIILASNVLEHPAFTRFIEEAVRRVPGAAVLVTGDLLNVFPEPGEDLEGSVFHELFGGDLITKEMDRQLVERFRNVRGSRFIEPLRAMFGPTGARCEDATRSADARYGRLLPRLSAAAGASDFYFIPGNMDYPRLAERHCVRLPNMHMLDVEVANLGGLRIGGLGGVPNTVHPFRGVVEISPYEMTEAEYGRRLRSLHGVDVLVTHVSPAECPVLDDFLMSGPTQVLICRAPFDFQRAHDFRGAMEVQHRGEKTVVFVRPFDHPVNAAVVVDSSQDLGSAEAYSVLRWRDAHNHRERGAFSSALTGPELHSAQ